MEKKWGIVTRSTEPFTRNSWYKWFDGATEGSVYECEPRRSTEHGGTIQMFLITTLPMDDTKVGGVVH